ncbi:LacI family DNA-binding transcriptional regulator [Microbacterium sp. H1-D42]|uniref:LacI family DNA-binding transcriptional regulator n=1 Tax=Microbacterium sp. H1-D42 TaxID=2925844 RepID=UPI001F53D9DE|nr:LacI family DNA-binding transcriptional regulator [Microbacterium sp. H1-D42]UNK70692.1 LacI family transcriptional regulator [Microbacterium sp. H1-D42]
MAAPSDPSRRVTIYDVAEAAGVSPSTVSRALSRPGRISALTADKIRVAADALGYQRLAGLPSGEPAELRLLVMLVNDIGNPVFVELIRGVEAVADAAGYTVVLLDSRESHVRERLVEEFFPAVSGLVLASPRLSDSGIRRLAKTRPLVVLNRAVHGVPSILADTARGARTAAGHLHDLGHREITYLAGPETSWADGMRWRALQEAARELSIRVRRLGAHQPTVSGGHAAARSWMEQQTTAVLAFNDVVATGFMQVAEENGFDVPTDVSVIGFDNSQLASLVRPGLTSIAAPSRKQGEAAARALIDIIDGARPDPIPLYLPTRLISRSSTAPVPPA